MDFIEKAKGLLTDPVNTFEALKEDTLEDAIKYYVVIVAVASLFSAGTLMLGMGSLGSMMGNTAVGIGSVAAIFVIMLVMWIIGAFISGAIIHIGVLIVGGKNGIAQTIKAIMYGSTPGLLLGWIPLIGILAGIWGLALEIIGVRQLHAITTGRAIIAVIIPGVIIVVLTMLLAAVLAAFVFGMGGSY